MAGPKAARTLTLEELSKQKQPLPKSWKKAAGLLRHKKKELEHHLKRIRLEWERRTSPE